MTHPSTQAGQSSLPIATTSQAAMFQQMVEEANDVIATWGLDGRLTYLSPSFQTILGHDPTDWLGQPFEPTVHPDDLASCLAANQAVAATGEKRSGIAFRHIHKQGHWVWVSVNIAPIKDETGQVVALLGVLRDIDELTHQRAELEQARQFLQQVLDVMPIAIAWKDRDSVYQGINQQFLGPMGVDSTQAVIGKTDYDMPWTTEQADWYRLCDRRVMDSGQAELNIQEKQQANGQEVFLNTNKVPLRDPAGNITGILATVEDVTEQRLANRAIEEYADRQMLLNKLSSQIRHSLDLETVLATALTTIRTILEIDSCSFAWYDAQPEGSLAWYDATTQAEGAIWQIIQESKREGIPSALGVYPAQWVGISEVELFNQTVLQIDDTSLCSNPAHHSFLQTIGCKSELLLPIQTQDERLGIIICENYQDVRPWQSDEVELLTAVTDQVAIAIDQANLYAASHRQSAELTATLQELQQAQSKMLQSEKMSSLGQLVAGIAHEINNPVNFIHGNINYARDYSHDLLDLVALYQSSYPEATPAIAEKLEAIDLSFIQDDLRNVLDSMKMGSERIREIVKSLRLFSRLDEAEVKPVDIHDGIDSTLMILKSRLTLKAQSREISIIKNYGELPEVECFAGQLNQVFLNILANAIDAVESSCDTLMAAGQTDYQPQITVTTIIQADYVEIRFADNGTGMPESVQRQIFDPFFTTKAIGKGTGMGMSISYQLITEKHGGQLLCESEAGEGTTFIIRIPIHQALS